MAVAIHVPRVNNNDDEVKLVELKVAVGAKVSEGQVVAAVETDKAVVDVEAPAHGFVLAIQGELEATLRVGSVLVWLGETADETPPVAAPAAASAPGGGARGALPTAKALALLRTHGLKAEDVAASGERLSAEDVERHVAASGERASALHARRASAPEAPPEVTGALKALRSDERGMLATVTWHRDFAAPGYLEITFDQEPWEEVAGVFQKQHGLLLNPLLPLLAWRLVTLAAGKPKLNATIVGNRRHEFGVVNLGFTVQAGEVLYLAVVREAAALDELGFVNRLIDLQRRGAGHALGPTETSGATIGFSSMARWKVARHIPVLAPQTSVMVAHTVDAEGRGVLGATYDHRVLHGADVVAALRSLAKPPARG